MTPALARTIKLMYGRWAAISTTCCQTNGCRFITSITLTKDEADFGWSKVKAPRQCFVAAGGGYKGQQRRGEEEDFAQEGVIGHCNSIINKRCNLLNRLLLVYDGDGQAQPGSSQSFQKIPTDGRSKQMADAPHIIQVSQVG